MAASNVCWGIELGSGAVKAIRLEREGDGVKVTDWAVIPHKRVLSTPELDQNEAMRVALGTLVSQTDLSGAGVAVSVPGHSAFARFAKLPPAEPKAIPGIVKFEAIQQIPFPIEDVEWDYQTFANPDSPEVEVGIFAMTRERVMERLALWQDVGVTPDVITLSPVAAYNAVAYDQAITERTPGLVILDVGTTSTDLIVAEGGRVWIRTFPVGGHQFTEALVSNFKLSYVKAEKLKREAEQSKHARHIFQAMRPVFADLAQDVQRSLGYYQSLHRDANLTKLIGLGSTFRLPGLRKYLSQQLQMEVVRQEGFSRVEDDSDRGEQFKDASLNLTTAYGLALQGLGFQSIDANLVPVPVVREALWSRKVKWFGVAAGLALTAGAVSLGNAFMERNKERGIVRPGVISQTKNEIRRLNNEWRQVETAFVRDERAVMATRLLERRDVYPWMVADVGRMLAAAQRPEAGRHPTETGFIFDRLDTSFVIPDRQQEQRGFGRRPQPDEPPALEGERVRVVLEVATARQDAERFVRETIQQWLYDNVDREGVPYTIDRNTVRWSVVGEQRIASEEEIEEPGRRPGRELTRRPGMRDDMPPDLDVGEVVGEGVETVTQRRGPQQVGTRRGSDDLDRLVPLPDPPPPAPPGSVLKFFRIEWHIVLRGEELEGRS